MRCGGLTNRNVDAVRGHEAAVKRRPSPQRSRRQRATSSAPSEVEAVEWRRLYVSVVVEKADLGLYQLFSRQGM